MVCAPEWTISAQRIKRPPQCSDVNASSYLSNSFFQDNYKQRRRQAAGAVLSNLVRGNNNNNKKKQSTAQPRPEIRVPPRGIGPVTELNTNDVLCGRGGRINAHPGNVRFRDIVQERKKEYLAKTTKKLAKAHIAANIVHGIRDLGGRFLKEEADGWYDIGDAKAIKKVGQALREDAVEVRQELVEDDSEEEGTTTNNTTVTLKPIATQHLPAQPQTSTQIMPPPQSKFHQKTTASGAAAAAVTNDNDDDDATLMDDAFGRQFHPPARLLEKETSVISGLSNPMSGISGLSGDDRKRPPFHARRNSASDLPSHNSMAEHSLLGGGIRDGSQLATSNLSGMISVSNSDLTNRSHLSQQYLLYQQAQTPLHMVQQQQLYNVAMMQQQQQQMMGAMYQPVQVISRPTSHLSSSQGSNVASNLSYVPSLSSNVPSNLASDLQSVASMSVNSIDPGSVISMSELSAGLSALDLADAKIVGRIK